MLTADEDLGDEDLIVTRSIDADARVGPFAVEKVPPMSRRFHPASDSERRYVIHARRHKKIFADLRPTHARCTLNHRSSLPVRVAKESVTRHLPRKISRDPSKIVVPLKHRQPRTRTLSIYKIMDHRFVGRLTERSYPRTQQDGQCHCGKY